MKDSIKRFVGRAVAVVSALPFALSSLPASADSTVILLDSITTRYIFGDSISGGYLDNEGNFKSCTFEFSDLLSLGSSNLPNQGNYGSSTTILLHYRAEVQNDIGQVLTNFQPMCYLDLDVTLENVTSFQWLSGAWINGVWTTTNLSTLNTYAYMISSAPALPASSIGIGDGRYRTTFQGNRYSSGKAGLFQVNGFDKAFSGCFYSVSSASAGSLYLDTIQFCCCFYSGGFLEIAFTCPYVNDDFVIPSDSPEIPSIGVGGSGSGTVSENSSGGYDFNYNIDIDIPDYSGQLDTIANPSLSSEQSDALSGLGDANSAVGDAVDDYDGLIDDIDSYEWEIDGDSFALDTIDQDLPDLTPPTDIVDGVNDLWELLELDRSAPIILRYMPILILFMVGSYVIFGKWI